MVSIGSCLFCDMCGTLLDKKVVLPGQQRPMVECHRCQAMNEGSSCALAHIYIYILLLIFLYSNAHLFLLRHHTDTSQQVIVTRSRPDAFPSALRDKRAQVQKLTAEQRQNTRARTEQLCEKCGQEEVWYHTMQLRSADEGSTVFYECDCGHKYVYPFSMIVVDSSTLSFQLLTAPVSLLAF